MKPSRVTKHIPEWRSWQNLLEIPFRWPVSLIPILLLVLLYTFYPQPIEFLGDALDHWQHATQSATTGWVQTGSWFNGLRWGIRVPAFLAASLFGDGAGVYYIGPLLMMGIFLTSFSFVVERLFGPGYVALFWLFYLVLPEFWRMSFQLLPSTFGLGAFGIFVLFCYFYMQKRTLWLFVLTVASLFIIYGSKFPHSFFFPGFFLFLLWKRQYKLAGVFAITMAGLYALETVFLNSVTGMGTPLGRLNALFMVKQSVTDGQPESLSSLNTLPQVQQPTTDSQVDHITFATFFLRWVLVSDISRFFYFTFFLLAPYLFWLRRHQQHTSDQLMQALVMTGGSFAVITTFFINSINPLRLGMNMIPRYLIILLPITILTILWALWIMWQKETSQNVRIRFILLLPLAFFSSMFFHYTQESDIPRYLLMVYGGGALLLVLLLGLTLAPRFTQWLARLGLLWLPLVVFSALSVNLEYRGDSLNHLLYLSLTLALTLLMPPLQRQRLVLAGGVCVLAILLAVIVIAGWPSVGFFPKIGLAHWWQDSRLLILALTVLLSGGLSILNPDDRATLGIKLIALLPILFFVGALIYNFWHGVSIYLLVINGGAVVMLGLLLFLPVATIRQLVKQALILLDRLLLGLLSRLGEADCLVLLPLLWLPFALSLWYMTHTNGSADREAMLLSLFYLSLSLTLALVHLLQNEQFYAIVDRLRSLFILAVFLGGMTIGPFYVLHHYPTSSYINNNYNVWEAEAFFSNIVTEFKENDNCLVTGMVSKNIQLLGFPLSSENKLRLAQQGVDFSGRTVSQDVYELVDENLLVLAPQCTCSAEYYYGDAYIHRAPLSPELQTAITQYLAAHCPAE